VATALHERWADKWIMIAGDDDHRLENNPGRVKALEASLAVAGHGRFLSAASSARSSSAEPCTIT
jgi:phage/plasmid primase-like uncharacterized protein